VKRWAYSTSPPGSRLGTYLVVSILLASGGAALSSPTGRPSGSGSDSAPYTLGARVFSAPAAGNVSSACTFPANSSCPHPAGPLPATGSPAGAPPPSSGGYNGLYWMSDLYTGTGFTSTNVSATIQVPSSGPRAGDLYFELLSVFDDNGNYDQIGLEANGNSAAYTWLSVYSMASSCGSVFTTGAVAAPPPAPGGAYNYQMTVGGGILAFNVDGVQFANIPDSAPHFVVARGYTCPSTGQGFPDFTDYQEVHKLVTGSFPQWDFAFTDTTAGSTVITSWTDDSSGAPGGYAGFPCPCALPLTPHGYWTVISGLSAGSVQIANQGFEPQFPWSYATILQGGRVTDIGSAVSVGNWCSSTTTCYLDLNCPTTWFNTSYGWGPKVPGALDYWAYSSPTTPLGTYYTGCYVGISTTPGGTPYETTTWIFYITVA
jgi:hypothetical protein